ncbi:MAG: hypothetical protein ACI8QD_000185 [Cyclobacteriaceae bacterium]|jgi:hypothetical protein
MMSEEHVDRIIEDVQSSSIKDQGLKDDLIDHLSCLIEIEMKGGTSFEHAYAAAFQQTAPNGLHEIQKETIFLLNYHKIMGMKRLMYASGYLFALTWIVGIFFKIMHLPAAMTLMFVGGSGLAFVFLPLVLINRFKRSAFKVMSEKLKWILGSLSIMLLMLSSWMKLAHLQGAAVMLGLSFLLFGFGFLPFLFFRMYKRSVTEL